MTIIKKSMHRDENEMPGKESASSPTLERVSLARLRTHRDFVSIVMHQRSGRITDLP